MSQNEIRRKFPPGEPKGLEEAPFRARLRPALVAYHEVLGEFEPRTYFHSVARAHSDGMRVVPMPLPGYWQVWDAPAQALSRTAITGLLDYVWERGELPRAFVGPDPTRATWERDVVWRLIHEPLARVLEQVAIDVAIDKGEAGPPELPADALDRCVEELVVRYCHGKHRYVAKCLLESIDADPGSSWPLSEGIDLRVYDRRDSFRYLTRNARVFSFHDTPHFMHHQAVIEMVLLVPPRDMRPRRVLNEVLAEEITDLIDVVKWAFMLGYGMRTPLMEGWTVYEHMLGGTVDGTVLPNAFRRQAASQSSVYRLEEGGMKEAKGLLRRGREARRVSKDLNDAFWLFGRSCVAQLARDVLLDAVIGLERLLVPRVSGETTYRFRLHGSALLAQSEEHAQQCWKELGRIYSRRSDAAHGGTGAFKEASLARLYLAQAIRSVIHLAESGKLCLSKTIPNQIQGEVLKRAPIHVHTE